MFCCRPTALISAPSAEPALSGPFPLLDSATTSLGLLFAARSSSIQAPILPTNPTTLLSALHSPHAGPLMHPSVSLAAPHSPMLASAAANESMSTLLPGPSTRLAQPSLGATSLPLYTADAYSLMKGSYGHMVSSWPQLTMAAVSNSNADPTSTPHFSAQTAPAKEATDVASVAQTMAGVGLVDQGSDDASSEDSDPAALVEDALLGELFFQQLEAQQQVRLCLLPHCMRVSDDWCCCCSAWPPGFLISWCNTRKRLALRADATFLLSRRLQQR